MQDGVSGKVYGLSLAFFCIYSLINFILCSRLFNVGSGLTDKVRKNPPKIGTDKKKIEVGHQLVMLREVDDSQPLLMLTMMMARGTRSGEL